MPHRTRARFGPFSLEFLAALFAAVSLTIRAAEAQVTCSRQPVISSVDPPSGSRQTQFTILGENLDQPATITVTQFFGGADRNILASMNVTERGITFTVSPVSPAGDLARFTLGPDEEGCDSVTVEIFVVFIDSFTQLLGGTQTVQPGSVLATSSACLPPTCGDNSTGYEVLLAGTTLQELQADSVSFIVRLPDTDRDYDNVELFIQTFYSLLSTNARVNFRRSPPITSLSPSRGQRGTRVVIVGENLLGNGEGDIEFSRVLIGSSDAEVDSRSNSTHIFARVVSGVPDSSTITVNTTQTISGGEYDGPYTYSDSLWTQLEDGVVSEIVPPAAQISSTVSVCGERLRGGGTNVVSITIADQDVENHGVVVASGALECIEIQVPSVSSPEDVPPGGVTIESDTGAIVESLPSISFTYAVVTNVVPTQGQVGTEVTISGIGLLSGYPTLSPTVFLAGVGATVVSFTSERIVVRVQDLEMGSASGSGNSTNSTGDTVVTVMRGSTEFSVSLAGSWEYLDPGTIQLVQPDFGQFGTRVTLSGTNLLGYGSRLREVRVDGSSAEIVSETDSEVVIDAPDIQTLGRVDIILESNNGALVSLSEAFEYRERGVILGLDPASGQNGTFVFITGSNLFGHASSITSVLFGDIAAEVDSGNTDNSMIRVRVQANDVTVDTPVRVVITAATMAQVGSGGSDWTYLVPGRVGDVRPNTGQTGTAVTVTGTNLLGGGSTVQSILLDGVPATVTEATPTSITVSMEDLSEQIEFYRGTVHIVANTGAVVVGGAYTHRQSGVITGVSPTTGREGTRITITGTNLPGYGNRVTDVIIAGVRGGIVEQVGDSVVVVRAGAASNGTVGVVTLSSDTGAVITSPTSLVFTYTERGRIDSVSPSEGAEGSGVLIQGLFLRPPVTVVTSVTIGGSPVLRIVTESESEVSVVVGPAPESGGNDSVVVITANDGSIVRGGNFTYLDLTLSLPLLNQGQQGTRVTIGLPEDEAFNPSLPLVARIGGQIAETLSSSLPNRSIEVITPRAGEVGTFSVDVTVEGIDGRVARLRDGFTYIEEGVIFSVSPDRGQRGTRIRVAGRNLLGGGSFIQSARVSQRGGREVSANVTDSDDENVYLEILANFPLDSAFPLTADVTLEADTGATIVGVGVLILVQPGQITAVTPSSGQFGTRVTITGDSLLQGGTGENIASITLAGTEVHEILDTPTDTEITVRANSSAEGAPGSVVITLTTGAEIITPDSITFQYLPPGVINSVSPAVGTVGTRVMISGENLLGGGMVQEVTLGGQQAQILPTPTNSQLIVSARAPGDGINGSGVVEILINTGAVISGGEWEFEELGVIMGLSPSLGQQGATVTISGISLLGSSAQRFSSCSLAGVPGTVTQSTDDEALCVAGFNPFAANTSNPDRLSGPVELVTNSGPVIVSQQQFNYYVANIEQIEPMNGTNGTFVNITGLNLLGSAESGESEIDSVRFGSFKAISTEVLTRDSIRVRVGHSPTPDSGLPVRLELESGVFLLLDDAWDYTEPGEISSLSSSSAQPGQEVAITGINLVPPCVSEVSVIVGQTRSYEAVIINSSEVNFRPGPYQASVGGDSNLEPLGRALPIQIIASNGATVYASTGLFTYSESEARVSSITPLAGTEGTKVAITGINLLYNSTAVAVTLAGRNATILNASDTEVVVIAGEGPRDGVLGRLIIESDEGLVSGIGTDVWQYLPVITASDVSPQTGQQGTIVSIDLKGISLVITSVSLAGVRADGPVDISGTRVIVEARPSEQTPVGDVMIEFEGGVSLTIPSAWSYLEPATVDNLAPDSGYFNSEVRITGENLRAGGRPVSSVEIAGLATAIVSQEDSEIVVRVSEFRDSSTGAIQGTVTITWEDGATFTSSEAISFTYVQLEVREISPQSGQGGTLVSVTGVGLLAGSSSSQPLLEAQLGGVAVQSVSLLSDTRIDLVASASTEATTVGDVSYTVGGGGQVLVEDVWSYLEPGEVAEVTPLQAIQGSLITIRGEGMLQGGERVSQVTIAGVEVMEIVVGLDDIIQVRLGLTPGRPQGLINIVSDTGAMLSNSSIGFQYLDGGVVVGVSPDSGQNGTRVTITWLAFTTTFGDVVGVTLAGVEVNSFQRVTDISVTVEVSRPDILEEFSGVAMIEIDSGAIITGDQIMFTYNREGVIYSAYPPQGQNGTRVFISGERLRGGGDGIERAFLAGIEAVVTASNASSVTLTASTPSTSESITGDIVLVGESGAYVRKIDAWTYVTRGTVVNIEPPQGQFGTRVTITGTGLLSGGDSVARVSVGDVTTTDISSSTDASVEARMGEPMTTDSFVDSVTLFSNFGGELQSLFSWSYLEASRAITHSPTSGVGGVTVTVDGERFLGGGTRIDSVTTAGVPAMTINEGTSNDSVIFTVGYHPTGADVQGDIVIESDTGALTIIEDGWRYESACPVGQFGSFANCMNCSEQCVGCDGPSNEDCLECRNFVVPLPGLGTRCVERCPNVSTLEMVCVDACNRDQYSRTDTEQDAVFCYQCSQLCDETLGCSGPAPTECGGCDAALDRDSRTCVEACRMGAWLSEDRVCVPCDSQCNATAGCFGETSSDCYQCLNVRISSAFLGSGGSGDEAISDVCLESCPSAFYEDSDGNCLPCNEQCLGACTGPTAFDCSECASTTLLQDGAEFCVSSCNAGSQITMFEDSNGSCGTCSRLCSLEDGCTGPTDADCITCRLNRTSNVTLPRFGGACVLACPNTTASLTPRPTRFYYHDIFTGSCELCDTSCSNSCRGPSPDDCLGLSSEDTEPFSAGPGTIAVTVFIILLLAAALVILVSIIVVSLVRRRQDYKVNLRGGDQGEVEMEVRYSRRPNDSSLAVSSSKSPPAEAATVSADDEYTQMAPGEPIAPTLKRTPQHQAQEKPGRTSMIQESGVTMIENEGAVYSQAGPEAPNVPARPAKQTKQTEEKPKPGKGRKTSEDRKSLTSPPPVIPLKPLVTSPSKISIPEKKPAAPLPPPSAETDGEMYTDMSVNVQEVYVGPDEEYSDMAAGRQEVEELVYEDAVSPPLSPQKSTNDTAPLIESLYEETDDTVAGSDYQKMKHSKTSAALPSQATPTGPKPFPRSRSSTPLPQTPLEMSLQASKPAASIPEDLYEETEAGAIPEESLYEAIGGHSRPLPDEPSPEVIPKERSRKDSVNPPLPPKGRK